ncbi:hypothetical protein CO151_07575 [bacterium CG_4_9_14_3_um_filter_65_15]|nr:MAG: hypothetical protein CO151_07575 [bacterium CG_4_9_14_3_um_filter_65_15]
MEEINAQASSDRRAQGQNWPPRIYRPITMLVFVALIVVRWLGRSVRNLGEGEVLKLLDNIIEIGQGGHVIGRSAAKILPQIVWSTKRD